jgi:hypothetical protein
MNLGHFDYLVVLGLSEVVFDLDVGVAGVGDLDFDFVFMCDFVVVDIEVGFEDLLGRLLGCNNFHDLILRILLHTL